MRRRLHTSQGRVKITPSGRNINARPRHVCISRARSLKPRPVRPSLSASAAATAGEGSTLDDSAAPTGRVPAPDPGRVRDQSLLQVITDRLPIGIAYVDPDRIYRFANMRFAAAYGLTPDTILGMRAQDFIGSDAMELGDPFFEAAFRGTAVDFLHPARHADGRNLTVRTFLRPDISAEGAVRGFFVCSFNVTREKEAEAALLHARKLDAVGQMASGIAHDVNNLLAVILGTIEPLRDRIADPDLREQFLDPALHAVDQGRTLTRQLLAFARRQPLRPEPVDPEACLKDVVRLLRRTLPADIALDTEIRGTPPAVFLDRAQFEVALLNLGLNARDAMPEGGRIGIGLVHPSPGAGAGFVRLTVSDSGCGIAAEHLGQIFEPFFTTKPGGQGTGLGLSMVWGFVRQSAGRIAVDSRPGEGTRFLLDLPVAAQPARPAGPPAQTSAPDRPRPAARFVLVVDDNHALRRAIRRQLSAAGHRVVEADSAEEALPLIAALDGLDVLLSDVVMPGMSGTDLAAAARDLRPGLRVVLMTGTDPKDGATPAATVAAGSLPLLRKPFPAGALVAAVEAAGPC